MAKDAQDAGIVFGDWKLLPMDSLNWELCHRHVTKATPGAVRNGTAGTVSWHRLGRYYDHHTIGAALRYAADAELKAGAKEREIPIRAALEEYEEILRDFTEAVAAIGHDGR